MLSVSSGSSPLITVLMPVYNAMPYLPMAVESLLSQTEERIRILAINDGSTDGSVDYLASVNDPRLTVLTQPNKGLVPSLNRALAMVETPFVARMDADDISHPERFARQIHFLDAHADCVLVGCAAHHIGTAGGSPAWQIHMPLTHEEIVSAMLQRRSAIIHATIFVRSDTLRLVGPYSSEAWPAEDYELFLRMGLRGRLANLPEKLYSIRLHPSSITSSITVRGQRQYELVCKHYRSLYLPQGPLSARNAGKSRLWPLGEMTLWCDIRSVFYYRRGITAHVNGKRVRGLLLLVVAAILSPGRTLEHMRRQMISRKLE